MILWWEKFPDRLEAELAALDEAGIKHHVIEEAQEKGIYALDLRFSDEGRKHHLIAVFPDLYPYFRPEVLAPDLRLPRHQNPFSKQLCLIGRRTRNWNTSEGRLATLIIDRFHDVLAYEDENADPEDLPPEEPQGEPVSDYFTHFTLEGSCILVDSSWEFDKKISGGWLEICCSIDSIDGKPSGPPQRVRGLVKCIMDHKKNDLEVWEGEIPDEYNKTIFCNWARVNAIPMINDSSEFRSAISELRPEHILNPWKPSINLEGQSAKFGDHLICIDGVVFDEEVTQHKLGDGWLFLLSTKPAGGAFRRKKHAVAPRKDTYFISAMRAGNLDMGFRIPAKKSLENKKIAIVGVGAIGAPIAIEMARNGAKQIYLIDGDTVEPGPTLRWPLGYSAFGLRKTHALHLFLKKNYPNTLVEFFPPIKLGGIYELENKKDFYEWDHITKILNDVHLVIDATAEVGVAHLLSVMCSGRSVPFISAYATPGAWGGLVARIDPARNQGCWRCLREAVYGEREDVKRIPQPPFDHDTEKGVQPPGCTDPTFLGAGFDLNEVSLEAVRMAVSTLGADDDSGYPETDWDVAVLSLRDKGKRIPVKWETFPLEKIEGCECNKEN